MEKKLYRSRTDRVLAGICGGLGEYFDIDPVIFRILFVVFFFMGGFSLLLYIVLIFIIPLEPGFSSSTGSRQDSSTKSESGQSEKKEERSAPLRTVFAIIIILMGVALLLNAFSPAFFTWFRWDIFWAVIILLIGLAILVRR